MPARQFLSIFTAILALSGGQLRAAEPQSLDQMLTPYLQEFGLPAIAAAVFQNGSIVASGAVAPGAPGAHSCNHQ